MGPYGTCINEIPSQILWKKNEKITFYSSFTTDFGLCLICAILNPRICPMNELKYSFSVSI